MVFLAALAALPIGSFACSVPVFRYALERWHPDDYHVTIFHRGPVNESDARLASALKAAAIQNLANIDVELADVAGELSPAVKALWESQEKATAPWMVLREPGGKTTLWAGPLSGSTVEALLRSPKRQEIAKRLSGGEGLPPEYRRGPDSVVWVLLESGDQAKDDAAARLLAEELARAARQLAPGVVERLKDAGLDDDEAKAIRVAFSVVRLSRSDAAEKLLTAMLQSGEEDLKRYVDQPMVFPIFGRGRALCAIVGKGITPGNIREACQFTVGDCSCEVKDDNPGRDLLIATDWSGAVATDYVSLAETGPLTGLRITDLATASRPATMPATRPSEAVGPLDASYVPPAAALPLRNALLAVGGIAVLAMAVGIFAAVRGKRNQAGGAP